MALAPPLLESGPAVSERLLRRLEEDLVALSDRLDAAVADPAMGDGLAAMGLDQASQAVHLAPIEVRDAIRASSRRRGGPAAP